MPSDDNIPTLEQRRESILAELAAIGDLRPGSLAQRYIRCGSPGCRCRRTPGLGRGVPALPPPVRRSDRGQRAALRHPARSRQRRERQEKACARRGTPRGAAPRPPRGPTRDAARPCRQLRAGPQVRRLHRAPPRAMRYDRFRAQGFRVGSGVVDGACKNLVGGRLQCSGMHWTADGANAILELRSCILSGRYEQFRELRAEGCGSLAA